MSFSKAHRFKPHLYYFSLLCLALSHPVRIAILKKILDFFEDIPFVSYRINDDLPGIKKGICNLVYQSDPTRLKAFENEIEFLSRRRRSGTSQDEIDQEPIWTDW